MSDSIKRIFLLFLMLSVIMSVTVLASNLNLKEVEIVFSDGSKTHLTVSQNKSSEEILKENNIILLDDEHIRNSSDYNKIYIDKKETEVKVIKTEVLSALTKENIENNYVQIVEKIELQQVEIPFNTITKVSKNQEENNSNSMVIQIGENGIKEITFKSLYKGNELIEKNKISEKIIKQPKDKIIQLVPKVTSRHANRQTTTYSSGKWNFSESEIEELCRITAAEAHSSYEASLAVITSACNRAESSRWRKYGNPLQQYKAPYQYTKNRVSNYRPYVKQAVIDALNGKRNHNYFSFKSKWYADKHGITGVNIGNNIYHGEQIGR